MWYTDSCLKHVRAGRIFYCRCHLCFACIRLNCQILPPLLLSKSSSTFRAGLLVLVDGTFQSTLCCSDLVFVPRITRSWVGPDLFQPFCEIAVQPHDGFRRFAHLSHVVSLRVRRSESFNGGERAIKLLNIAFDFVNAAVYFPTIVKNGVGIVPRTCCSIHSAHFYGVKSAAGLQPGRSSYHMHCSPVHRHSCCLGMPVLPAV